ncbi:PR-1-like protein [Hyaloscypha variabilis F]|uniref:PR-1-like protein n=1 Tax=Hyaloscypha variabilis (strain UAMH 11265 / GT02V1 / F) TaxID=1149755 RepID=A0A2J6QWS3_HYAVF|nr:PR-1-like protein [Hyaloscypha variabilis F]
MRSSTILAALSAALVAASPVHQALHARKIVTDIVTEIVYTTVTEGLLPTPAPQVKTVVIASTVVVLPIEATHSTQPAPPPPPPPASTHSTTAPAPVVIPPQTEVQAPAAPVPTTTKEAVVQAPASTAPASTAAAPASTPTDYISAAIDHHNYHRSNHSASDISWSDDLAASALVVANSCVFAHNMDVDGGGYGQNLAAYGTSDTGSLDTASLVAWSITQEWYDGEINAIPWGEDSPSTSGPEFLHATQVIWKGSNEVGCATVQCAPGTIFGMTSWYTVCNYGPQGNVMGEFNSEISEGLGHPTIYATIS